MKSAENEHCARGLRLASSVTVMNRPQSFQPGERVVVVWTDGSRKLGIIESAYPGRYLVSFSRGHLLWVLASFVMSA